MPVDTGASVILGIDEVGRGPWAGPLVIGAVILGPDFAKLPEYDELTDSKKLSAKKRETLAKVIEEHALATGLGWVSAEEIDRYSLGPSLKLATSRAVRAVLKTLQRFDKIIIDGTINFLEGTPLSDRVSLLKKADFLVKEVSAASIIAKVARDNYMVELAEKYPEYGFEKHVGYGTAAHQQALRNFGPCPEHRRSFRPIRELCQTFAPATPPSTISTTPTSTGQTAESAIADYLVGHGHTIITRNFKTKLCEIDVISRLDDKLYFTEVKYRKTSAHGNSLTQITPTKLAQMRRAAEIFQAKNPALSHLQPLLAAGGVSGADFHIDDWFPLEA